MAAIAHQRNPSFSSFRKSAMVENDLTELNDAPGMDPCLKWAIFEN
jgi:hypothetical protein